MTKSSAHVTDAIVVGAGFAGMYMLIKLRELGLKPIVLEAGDEVGGTWHWNRYPGARCDIESLEYSYSFDPALEQEWEWTERYATQPEILDYARHVADRYDLRRDIVFNATVVSAAWSDEHQHWEVKTRSGDIYQARFLVTAVGCLSVPHNPEIKGLETYKGMVVHTGKWPHEGVDFAGKRVGVIGTGSSGIQAIPIVAAQAKKLVVFQRTPNYSIPAGNRRLNEDVVRRYKGRYDHYRDTARKSHVGIAALPVPIKAALEVDQMERASTYRFGWELGSTALTRMFTDIMRDHDANHTAAEFVREQIRAIVKDPAVAEKLQPKYPIGSKRLCLDTGYYDTYNRPNVELVDITATPITRFTETGIVAGDKQHDLDLIIFATGYDAVSGPVEAIGLSGTAGQSIKEKWSQGSRAYLGLMTSGFDNCFMITGPGSPSILSNVILAIEQHVDLIGKIIKHMAENDYAKVGVTSASEEAWRREIDNRASETLLGSGKSWYNGSNIEGKTKSFLAYPGGFGRFQTICDETIKNDFQGFVFE